MKKFRFITALVLVVGLLLSLPFAVQAEEKEFREIYVTGTYKVSDTEVMFVFSEPVQFNGKAPWMDLRMTNTSGSIIGIYDAAGNRTGYQQWTGTTVQYADEVHDKIIMAVTGEQWGCDSFSDLFSGKGTFDADPKKNAEILEKIEKKTYRFLIGMEEVWVNNAKEIMNDGMHKNLVSEKDPDVFVWPTRLNAGECVHAYVDELDPLPASIKLDRSKFEPMGGKGQEWGFDIMELGTPLEAEEETGSENVITTTVVKNDPMMIAIILGAGVLVAAVLIVVFVLASKKRKAA
jgi:hypothetical protein